MHPSKLTLPCDAEGVAACVNLAICGASLALQSLVSYTMGITSEQRTEMHPKTCVSEKNVLPIVDCISICVHICNAADHLVQANKETGKHHVCIKAEHTCAHTLYTFVTCLRKRKKSRVKSFPATFCGKGS